MSWSQTKQIAHEGAMVAWGAVVVEHLVEHYAGRALVFLHGQLGAGKTTLVRGMLQRLGHSGAVKSPTYTLLEPYELETQAVFHFDLYRVNDPDELALVGFDEVIDGPGIKLIEWPEKAENWLPPADVEISIDVLTEPLNTRTVHARSRT